MRGEPRHPSEEHDGLLQGVKDLGAGPEVRFEQFDPEVQAPAPGTNWPSPPPNVAVYDEDCLADPQEIDDSGRKVADEVTTCEVTTWGIELEPEVTTRSEHSVLGVEAICVLDSEIAVLEAHYVGPPSRETCI